MQKFEAIQKLSPNDFIGWPKGLLQNAREFWMCVQRLQLVNEERYTKGRELLISIVSMLVKMAQKQR